MEPDDRIAINDAIEAALGGAPAVVVATVTGSGEPPFLELASKLLIARDGGQIGTLGRADVDAVAEEVARSAYTALPRVGVQTLYVARGGTTTLRRHEAESSWAEVMVQLWEQPARLIVVGGGHVGLALATQGEQLGFAVTVIDDREDFANWERFPMAEHVLNGDLGEELDGIELDETAHVVLVSRGHVQDELALRHSTGRGAGYVGMIGSRRRTATVLQHLQSEGFDAEALDAVSTPIGLDIGAETPEEIALSILAEIVMLRRGRSGVRLREQRVGESDPSGAAS
jgi:xanthine dehydrogenase accessory factor